MATPELLHSNTITLRQLDYFVAAVRLGSMSAAARKLGVTPSAMSQQISVLEMTLGQKLFDPQRRGSNLTRFGTEFFVQASKVIESANLAFTIGKTYSDGPTIIVGATPTIAKKLIPPLISRLQQEGSIDNIEVVSFVSTLELCDALDKGIVDIAIGPLDSCPSKIARVIGTEELVVAVHRRHRHRVDGSWQQLSRLPWIKHGPPHDLAAIIATESARAGTTIRYTVTAPDTAVALSLVEHGVGVTLVPKMSLHGSSPSLSAVRLSPPIRRQLLVYANRMPAHVEKLLDMVTDTALLQRFDTAGLLEA